MNQQVRKYHSILITLDGKDSKEAKVDEVNEGFRNERDGIGTLLLFLIVLQSWSLKVGKQKVQMRKQTPLLLRN